jgi:poly(3-hydroxyalkanoate) synthetase
LKKTKYPLIFASMTADPVTPLSAARSMSKGFGNESATLLVQEGFGHCTIAHPSLCTAKKIRAYFLEGKVPEYGTQCKADPGFLFPNTTTPNFTSMNHMNCKERKLAKALHELSGLIHEMGMGLGSRI